MRALYVATDLRDADVLQQEVRRAAPKLTFDVCSGTAEARSRTEGTLNYDVMILDSSLPEQEQQQLIEHIRSRQIPLPIVILVGQNATPSSSIVAAADECITRGPRLAERLAPGLRMAIERYRVVVNVSRENERLKRSEARLRLIIEAMPAGVVLVDQTGKIQAMNLAGAALVGTAGPSDVVGRELYSLADHDGIQALRDLVARAFDGERGKVGFTCHGPDGALRPLQIEALCIQKDAQGQGSVLGVLSQATGEITAPAPLIEPSEESSVDFAFANDQHSDERMALEQALEEMRGEAARLSHEAESERSRVQQVLEELERSRATAAEHHAQKNQIEERHRAAEERLAELEARIGELDARHREDEGAAATLNARVTSLTGEAGELRGEREKLQKELEGLRADLSAQTKAQAEMLARAEAAEQERARVVGTAVTVQSNADARVKDIAAELRAAQAKAEANEKSLKAEIEKIRADAVRVAEALEAQGKDRKGAEAALAGARDALQARLQELEAQSADLETRRQAAVGRVAELEESRRADQAALATANKHQADLEQQLKAAREEAARAGSERDGLKSELGRVHESHRAVEDDASLKASEAARIKGELEGRVAQLQAELDKVHGERQAAQGALDATKAQADGTRSELDQLRAELEQRRADVHQRGGELEQRQAELGQARGELDQVRGELDRVRGEFDRVRAEVEQVRGELGQVRGELETTRGARDGFAREVDEVKAAVAKAATVIDELRQGREAIDARASAATGELDGLRREVEARGHHNTDLQQALERERAEARERAAETAREHQDALARLQKQIDEAREFQASAAASRGPAERGRRRQGERLGQLASAMANDLHGIVNVMADEGRKLLAELPEGSTVRAQAEQSLQTANRAGQLVRHLLRLSEREARATTGSDTNSLVRANEPMLRQLAGPDIDLRFELAPSLPPVECDADELAGLLSTLVVTVRGALPLGGSIRVTTQPPRKDGGRRRNDTSLALAVVAEGYGMVSVPTTVCDEVVSRSGGTFGAQVDLKAGTTTFTAYLPIDQSADAGVTNIA
jgi:PAS domain S-box-containing protein